jgi:hypothetical protein
VIFSSKQRIFFNMFQLVRRRHSVLMTEGVVGGKERSKGERNFVPCVMN